MLKPILKHENVISEITNYFFKGLQLAASCMPVNHWLTQVFKH